MALGLNRRNAVIARENPRAAVRLVRDKVATKQLLAAHGVAVPPSLAILAHRRDVSGSDWLDAAEAWVMKPAKGSQGRGVLVVLGCHAGSYQLASGRWVGPETLRLHADGILDGDFTDGRPDAVLIEPLLRSHEAIARMAPAGLPDIRVICFRREPVLAMMRLPTESSGGRGNLHQGGIGAAIDLTTGRVWRAVQGRQPLEVHPDTGQRIVGVQVPLWGDVLARAVAAASACGLGYAGLDLVIDRDLGVLVLEVNAHPGLEIQNVCAMSLADRVRGRG